MFHWRPYQASIDLKTLKEWAISYPDFLLREENLPKDSSFLFFWDNEPVYFISVILTNVKDFCIIENFIRNPTLKTRAECWSKGKAAIFRFIKQMGYNHYITTLTSPRLLQFYNRIFGTQLLKKDLLLAGGRV